MARLRGRRSQVAGRRSDRESGCRVAVWSGATRPSTLDLRPATLFLARKERAQSRVDVGLVGDRDRLELGVVELLERAHPRAAVAVAVRADLAIAELVGAHQQLLDQRPALLVVRGPVVAVGEVEGVDVPLLHRVAPVDQLQRQAVGAGGLGAAALAPGEELLLGDLPGLG